MINTKSMKMFVEFMRHADSIELTVTLNFQFHFYLIYGYWLKKRLIIDCNLKSDSERDKIILKIKSMMK